jgi:hypothetical protein
MKFDRLGHTCAHTNAHAHISKELDVFVLFHEVQQLGGFEAVVQEKRWKIVADGMCVCVYVCVCACVYMCVYRSSCAGETLENNR